MTEEEEVGWGEGDGRTLGKGPASSEDMQLVQIAPVADL